MAQPLLRIAVDGAGHGVAALAEIGRGAGEFHRRGLRRIGLGATVAFNSASTRLPLAARPGPPAGRLVVGQQFQPNRRDGPGRNVKRDRVRPLPLAPSTDTEWSACLANVAFMLEWQLGRVNGRPHGGGLLGFPLALLLVELGFVLDQFGLET